MKLYSVIVLRVSTSSELDPLVCASAIDVSDVGMFQRKAAREFLIFLSRTVAKRVAPGSLSQVKEGEHVIYCASAAGGRLAVCVACDAEYHPRVAFGLCRTVADQFQDAFRGKWETVPDPAAPTSTVTFDWAELEGMLKKYQNPAEADQLLRIQRDLDETKVVMYNAIDQVLKRGEHIDELVARSGDLSDSSKMFYTTAKSANSWCCAIM